MPTELDPFIARLVSRPEWLPTWSNEVWAAIADAGDAAHRRALDRWHAVRERGDATAYGAVAVLLAEAFDDDRALLAFAESTDRATLFEAVLPFAHVMTPEGRCARTLGKLFLTRMLHALGEGRLRTEIIDAIAHLRIDDHGEVYLTTRRALARELAGTPLEDAGERYADRVLVAAARATPNRPEVLRTVLSYWGAAEPLDDVPTAEPRGDEPPASWFATCELIAGVRRGDDAERLVTLAHDTEFWREGAPAAGRAYVDGLERSAAASAEDRLLEVAKADVPASGHAVRAIARRRTRMAGAPSIVQPRIEAVTGELIAAGVIPAPAGPRGTRVVHEAAATGDSALDLAALVLGVSGRAVTFELAAGERPLAEHVRRALAAVAAASGLARVPYELDDHSDIGAGVDVRHLESGVRVAFSDGRMSAAAFDALVPDGHDDEGRALQRIRIDADHVTYALVDPAAWSAYLDWAAATPLPEPSPVPARRASAAERGEQLGGMLGRLFGRR